MTWLAWRQFRASAVIAGVTIVAVTLVLVLTRHHISSVGDPGNLTTGYKTLQLLGSVLIGVPGFIGAFWGAPLLARELEAGTHRLAWTQSITRRRWLATKLAIAGCGAVLVAGVYSLVFTWWSLPLDHFGNRIGTANFGQRGIVPIAYALFALALGTFAGTVLRRLLPAMAVTVVGFILVRFCFQLFVRPNILDPVTRTLPNNLFGQREGSGVGSGGWIMSTHTVDAAGHPLDASQINQLLVGSCGATHQSSTTELGRCADRLGIQEIVRMHPASQFWTLQAWETGSFVALAAILAIASFWWIRHRTV